MASLGWTEQPIRFPKTWSNRTLNPTLINKITYDDCANLYIEQPIP